MNIIFLHLLLHNHSCWQVGVFSFLDAYTGKGGLGKIELNKPITQDIWVSITINFSNMSKIGQWLDALRNLVVPSDSTFDEGLVVCKNHRRMSSFYVVIEEVFDKDGHSYGYLYQHNFPTYREAEQKMKENDRYSQIDFWDGDEWWFDVKGHMEANVD